MKQKYYIDLHKGATFIYILLLMYFFSDCLSNQSNNNIAIYVYLALHGTYGILWILKSKIYPDKQWESKCSVWYGLLIWVGLSLYWIAPYIILTKNIPNNISPSNWYIAMCISMYIFGIFFHFTSDMQKFIQLKYNPNHLITDNNQTLFVGKDTNAGVYSIRIKGAKKTGTVSVTAESTTITSATSLFTADDVNGGNLLQPQLMEVDYLIYMLPGLGIYFWNPRDLNRLTWYLLTNYIQEDEWLEVDNTFRLVVANNQEWLSINYLVPYHMIYEPNYFRTDYDWENKKWNGTNVPVGPKKIIDWNEALSTAQSNNPETYNLLTSLVIKYANNYGEYKRERILKSWNLNPQQT